MLIHKRKASHISDTSDSPALPSKIAKGEYETGRVICEVCSEGISFRDETSGGFTLKHWDAHRLECSSPSQAPNEPVIYTPESTADALAHPPPRRRRAKRTEEERISYLRSDPYVSKFEAYRVLCAACDKWIRLRPNSTYCSIPWDAHRKSCLAKRAPTVNATASEERDSFLSKDPDIKTFEAERILCNICDKWLTATPTILLSSPTPRLKENLASPTEIRHKILAAEIPIIRSADAADARAKLHGRVLTDDETDWLADEVRSEGNAANEPRSRRTSEAAGTSSRRSYLQSADLRSSTGRINFVSASVHYLFSTTYDKSDDLTISALLTYLNAAIPLDKYEDFDTTEVVRAATQMRERGDALFEGDVLRLKN
ncbi:hypothetical protein HWV62_30147 [Athelia sp. TMB]|nr:hypothetical protein HWV62_30147 [Athelia sp. TMB]